MAQEAIPKEVLSFLADNITSVVELEALLLLHGHPGQPWKASEMARELRIDPAWPGTQLQILCNKGFLTCSPGADPIYTYEPKTPEMKAMIDALAHAYADRRVTIIGLIFAKPMDKLKSFADAFRIRKDPE